MLAAVVSEHRDSKYARTFSCTGHCQHGQYGQHGQHGLHFTFVLNGWREGLERCLRACQHGLTKMTGSLDL